MNDPYPKAIIAAALVAKNAARAAYATHANAYGAYVTARDDYDAAAATLAAAHDEVRAAYDAAAALADVAHDAACAAYAAAKAEGDA